MKTDDNQIGLALRMAISLGLHQEVSDQAISQIERDRRRRAWWSVYSLDRYAHSGIQKMCCVTPADSDRILSVKSGNPITIHDEDIGTAWPPLVRLPEDTARSRC